MRGADPAMEPTSTDLEEANRGVALDVARRLAAEVRVRCPRPVTVHQVAVLLETDGYNAARARTFGASGVMELAAAVWHVLEAAPAPRPAPAGWSIHRIRPESGGRREIADHVRAMGTGLWYSVPWMVALVTLVVAGVSYWASAVATPTVSVALTLALVTALLVTAPFVQAFARRGSFYYGFAAQTMLSRIVARTLECGLLCAALAGFGLWFLRQQVLGVGTPATNRLAGVATFAIAAFELGLAPLYLRRAFRLMLAIVAPGAVWLVILLLRQGYLNPLDLAWQQMVVVAAMAALAWATSAAVLLRSARQQPPRTMWKPREAALIRAVFPYALFGVATGGLVAGSQLVAGGVLSGSFAYNQTFALTSGAALVVLVPVLAQVTAATDRFVPHCQELMARQRLCDVGRLRAGVLAYWRIHLGLTLCIGALAGLVTALVAPHLGLAVLGGLGAHPALLWACLAGYVLLAAGLLDVQLLFCLSTPRPAVVSAWLGVVGGFGVPWLVSLAAPGASLATLGAVGLVSGSGLFALGASLGTWRVLGQAELAWYRAL